MFFLSQHLDFWLCCWLFLVLQDTNYEGKYRLCFTGVFLPGIFIQESVEYPFPFTVVYKLVQHDFLPGSSHSSDCTDPQQGGGGKCFGNGSQHRAQLHNCTEEKGFFFFGLFCFSFPYPPAYWKNVVGKLDGKNFSAVHPCGGMKCIEMFHLFYGCCFSSFRFDIYRKVPKDLTQPTYTGAISK